MLLATFSGFAVWLAVFALSTAAALSTTAVVIRGRRFRALRSSCLLGGSAVRSSTAFAAAATGGC